MRRAPNVAAKPILYKRACAGVGWWLSGLAKPDGSRDMHAHAAPHPRDCILPGSSPLRASMLTTRADSAVTPSVSKQ
jgi:hypothetical protein